MLGFNARDLPLDPEAARRMGLPPDLGDVRIVPGNGALRALIVDASSEISLRAVFTHLAAALASHTSHVLWLVIGAAAGGTEVGFACWTPGLRAPRVMALVARREGIVASDAESVRLIAATNTAEDLLVHTRWCELLGREALSRRFYRILEQRVRGLADSLQISSATDRADLALLCVSRLLFLSFLEAKGWLDRDIAFLAHHFDACMGRSGQFHRRVLLPLFFGTLNTPMRNRAEAARCFGAVPFLNGGLFARSALEGRHANARFSDEAMGALFSDLLGAYRFTAREGHDEWTEAAIDPEMLGRAFESLMATRERRVTGAFYTPQSMVAHMTDKALAVALSTDALAVEHVERALRGERLNDPSAEQLRTRLRTFTVLDPACGSGAFLVFVLERLATLHRAAGDNRHLSAIRREVLARAIHGVDVNPTAVWLCELRLWLSVVIESDETRMHAVPPLPNLDCNIRVGDTLSGDAFADPPSLVGPPSVLVRLRERYVRAAGPRKAPLRRALAREERHRALAAIDRQIAALSGQRRERLLAHRAADLFGERVTPGPGERADMRTLRLRAGALRGERRRIVDGGALPFSFPSHFGAAHAQGGFDLVIGNPPWVRLHNIPAAVRIALRARYASFRDAGWDPSGADSRTGRGFGAQIDLAALFVERSLALACPTGSVALLLPAKLWRSLSGGGTRRLLAANARLRVVEDWTDAPSAFDAAVYPSMVIASRHSAGDAGVDVAVRGRALDVTWRAACLDVRLVRQDAGSPWLLLPPQVRAAFDRVTAHGIPLAQSALGHATLGVKCGCNDAFTVDALSEDADMVCVAHLGRRGLVEREMLRPLLRGEAVAAWRIAPSATAMLWTHASSGAPLTVLPAGAARWLSPWRRQLTHRTDLRGGTRWWMLFRTEAADASRARVVWSDFGRVPRAALLPAGDPTVPLNSCYVVHCANLVDALALTALLNTPIAAAVLNAIAEPARGGWRRYLAWTVGLLPLPRDWARARDILAPLAERALLGNVPSSDELLMAACRAYRVRRADVAPLIAWCHAPTRD